jgi:tetraacyldisaccharide 4'-kinase
MFIFQYLLFPFALLYDLVTRIRNYLYDIGHKPSFEFETFVISVGNLNVGGSGKTPLVEYLIRLFIDKFKVATLSRGYGRKTRGFHLASNDDNARTIGDEPYQLLRKYGNKITVAVGEERALAISTILNEQPFVDVILMDDAFQHRSVKPQLSILVTDREKPFYKDYVLPMGRLREARIGAKRADIIVVTKADGIEENEKRFIHNEIIKIVGDKPVFFTGINYLPPLPINHSNLFTEPVLLVSGIAKNAQFERQTARKYKIHQHIRFPDHHSYTSQDILRIHQLAKSAGVVTILTTEKDMVKLIGADVSPMLNEMNWFYTPIEASFIENGTQFDTLAIQKINDHISSLKKEIMDDKS